MNVPQEPRSVITPAQGAALDRLRNVPPGTTNDVDARALLGLFERMDAACADWEAERDAADQRVRDLAVAVQAAIDDPTAHTFADVARTISQLPAVQEAAAETPLGQLGRAPSPRPREGSS